MPQTIDRNPFEQLLNPVQSIQSTSSVQSTSSTSFGQSTQQTARKPLTLITTGLELLSDENTSPTCKSPKNYTSFHGTDGLQYMCTLCDNIFKHKPDVIRHTKNVHSSREACKWCGKLLKTMGRSDAKRKHLENCGGFLKNLPKDISKEKIHRIVRCIVGDKRRKHHPMTPIDDDCNEIVARLLCK